MKLAYYLLAGTIAALTAAAILYIASYLALARIESIEVTNLGMAYEAHYLDYGVGGEVAAKAFYPINQIDRRLRPNVWQFVGEPSCLTEDDEP